MIDKFIHAWDKSRKSVKAQFQKAHPGCYADIVTIVITAIHAVLDEEDDYERPSPKRIRRVSFGGYSGTEVYVIGQDSYEPRKFWIVSVDYGSCGGCDTLHRIKDTASSYDDDGNDRLPTDEQVSQYMMLATHIVQAIKEV